jgi:hypothetical protein
MSALLVAVPNWTYNTAEMTEKGNIVRARVHIRGKNTGEMHLPVMGLTHREPTGKIIALPEERIEYAARMNKIYSIRCERTSGGSVTGILKQLGISIPEKVAV